MNEEQHRLNCLARWLYSKGRDAQESFYKKNPRLKEQMIDKIRSLLAEKLAAMPSYQREAWYRRYQSNPELYVDLKNKVRDIMKTKETTS